MRLAGFRPQLVAASRVTHDHRFWQQTLDQMGDRLFLIERNRYLVMFSNYKWPTILVLLPWIFFSEAALVLGLWKLYPHRVRLWRAVWSRNILLSISCAAKARAAGGKTPDGAILRAMTGPIRHGALKFRPIDRCLDAGLRWSHWILCKIICW